MVKLQSEQIKPTPWSYDFLGATIFLKIKSLLGIRILLQP